MANIPHHYPSFIEMEARYMKKKEMTVVEANTIITFADSGANIRIKNGTLQQKAPDGLFYELRIVEQGGGYVLQVTGNGET